MKDYKSKLYYYRPHRVSESGSEAPRTETFEVAVYGGTPTGVAAAIQAARSGRSTVLLCFNGFVGGMTSAGLTATDALEQESIGGFAAEFYAKVGQMADFRSADAEALFIEMLKAAGVVVLANRHLISVETDGASLISASFETACGTERVQAEVFIDGSYEGDLMAAAGVSYAVGREPLAAYDESLAGQWQVGSWSGVYQFCDLLISPYREPGECASGLLPEISTARLGKRGQGDFRIQAYNFRMFLSDKDDKIPFSKPPDYDPDRYALLARFLNLNAGIDWILDYTTAPLTDGPVQMRNGDSNNAGSFSTDLVGGSHRWPDGTFDPEAVFDRITPQRRGLPLPLKKLYELRERIFQDHVSYQQGLMYFLTNDTSVPKDLQKRIKRYGLDPKEFSETNYWPHQLYVREARRMVGNYVMTQHNCESKRIAEDSIGMASYPMDSHFCERVVVVENGRETVRNEGGFSLHCPQPYPVSYRAITPGKNECTNLLVPGCLSASHVAYGSIRMEPVFMILGQSAGMAASLAIEGGRPVQEVPYLKLRKALRECNQVL